MNKTSVLSIAVFDLLLTAVFLLANTFTANGTKTQTLSLPIYGQALLLAASVFLLAFLLLRMHLPARKAPVSQTAQAFPGKRIFWGNFLLLTLSWTLCLLVYFPGVGMNDGLNVLMGRLSSAN